MIVDQIWTGVIIVETVEVMFFWHQMRMISCCSHDYQSSLLCLHLVDQPVTDPSGGSLYSMNFAVLHMDCEIVLVVGTD